jgi:hypothetical protein
MPGWRSGLLARLGGLGELSGASCHPEIAYLHSSECAARQLKNRDRLNPKMEKISLGSSANRL